VKTFVVLLLFVVQVWTAQAQFRGYNWVFADSVGINFETHAVFVTEFVPEYTAPGFNSEVAASISQSNGMLLLYTNGRQVWNGSHQLIGDSVRGSFTVTNGAIILPSLNDSNQYIV
jgi:hypothetical protein